MCSQHAVIVLSPCALITVISGLGLELGLWGHTALPCPSFPSCDAFYECPLQARCWPRGQENKEDQTVSSDRQDDPTMGHQQVQCGKNTFPKQAANES